MFWRCTFIGVKIPSQLFQTLLNAIIEKKKKKKKNYREHIFVFVGHAIFFQSATYLDDAIATSAEILFALNENKTLDYINTFI